MKASSSFAACAPHRYGSLSSPRQSWVVSGASTPQRRIRLPWISSVSPSMMLACPIRSSAKATQPKASSTIPAIIPIHLATSSYPLPVDGGASKCCSAPIAVRNLFFGVVMDNIVDSVLSCYGHEVSGPTKEKLLGYIQLLASTGQTDDQLVTFGSAYLREISAPDPRYTGW